MSQGQLQAVLAGGAVFGVLSALPVIDTCCCLWMVCGGLVAAYLTQQGRPEPLQPGEGALAGLLAGIAGSVMFAVVSVPVRLVTAPIRQRIFEGLLDSSAQVPPELRQYLEGFSSDGGFGAVLVGLLVTFPLMLVLGSIFSTVGGLLGALFFRTSPPPASPAAPPPLPG